MIEHNEKTHNTRLQEYDHHLDEMNNEHHPAHKMDDVKLKDHKPAHNRHTQHSHHEGMIEDFKRRFYVSLFVTIPVIILSPMIQHWAGLQEDLRFTGDIYILFILSSFIYFYGGYPFLKGLKDELISKKPGMMTLIGLAITVAYLYSSLVVFGLQGEDFFWELATLIDIMLLGHWIEMRSVMGASKALEELVRILPSEAHRIKHDGSVEDIPLELIVKNDIILVKPGEKVPADGIVIDGESTINESMLTGESVPVNKKKGNDVIGGSVNGEGSLKVQVIKTGQESFLSQMIELVRSAQESKSKTQDLANKAAVILTFIAIVGGTITFLVWYFVASASTAFSLERTVTVMVITCPHALGVAIPLVVAVSTSIGAGKGLLIRDRLAFENARNIKAVVFDKTGTLTEGKFAVDEVISVNNYDKNELLNLAANVESLSDHPLAHAISSKLEKRLNVENFSSITGKGAKGTIDGNEIMIVSPGYLNENNIKYDDSYFREKISGGKTAVFVLINGKTEGIITLADIVRKESKEAVDQLHRMGIKSIMLTGDNKAVAASVSQQIGIDEYFAEVLPDKKSEKIKEIQSRGLTVAMTGDGVNDAPALAQADVGIAVGAGTDVAIESADIILIKNDPIDIVSVIELSKITYKKMIQNLLWATGYNVIAIPLAAGVLFSYGIILSPAVGAVLMSLSTVIVSINAKLLKL